MKKSKIIVPAMCLIAFTSFASIAGSVAWFTASRQVNLDAGTYTVVKTTSNLKAELTAGVATKLSTNGKAIELQDGANLTDGSFDHNNGVFTTPNENGDGQDDTKGQFAIGSTGWEANLVRMTYDNDTKKVYTAATFTITFTMNFGAISGDYGLFLDCGSSHFNAAQDPDDNTTAKGFRMAFYPQAVREGQSDVKNGVPKVYADLQDDEKCTYVVSGEQNEDGLKPSAYTGSALMDQDCNFGAPAAQASRADAMAKNNYLGFFHYEESSEIQLKYIVVAWFEGTDENIVNRTKAEEYQSVGTYLTFIAEPIADAPANP